MKKITIAILIAVLLVFTSCNKMKLPMTAAPTTTPSIQQLKAQIDDISLHISAQYSLLSRLQAQLKANSEIITRPVITTMTAVTTTTPVIITTTPTPTGPSNAEIAGEIDFLKTNIHNLGDKMSALEDQMQTLQDNLAGNATNIGITSQTVNGLNVLFITNNIDVGSTGPTTATSAQFALKITNNTSSIISNLDVTGLITTTVPFVSTVAAAYPQVTDGGGTATITSAYAGDKIVTYEAYSNSKTTTIPIGGTVTIRPKITILASANNRIPATTFILSVNAITYDKQ